MRCFLLLACLLTACSRPVPPPAPPVLDVLTLADAPVRGHVRDTPGLLALPPFSPLNGHPRLLVYAYPQVMQLTLPRDGLARDVAFFDLGGRAIDVYPAAACIPPGPCSPLPSRFPAMSVLIAPAGTLQRVKLVRTGQMRWEKGARAAVPRITPLAVDE